MESRKLMKVKWDGKRMQIKYQIEKEPADPDVYTLDCGEEPRRSFTDAMEGLREHVQKWLEIQGSKWWEDLEIRSVSFSHTDGIMGATITAIKPLGYSRSPLVLNTPHKPEEPYSEGDPDADDYCIPGECRRALIRLEDEANAYIDGKRAQGVLFGEGDEEGEAGGSFADAVAGSLDEAGIEYERNYAAKV